MRLFNRSAQGTELTEAGEVFLPQAEELLRAAERAAASTRAAVPRTEITIGHTAGLIITRAVRELRLHHPDADITTRHLHWDEPRRALLDHRVDVAVARLPFPTEQLRVSVLYEEPRYVAVPLDHRLARETTVTLNDIADEPLTRFPDELWNAFWRVDPRPDGRRAPDGPEVTAHEDNLELVAGGQALSLTPAGARPRLRPDLTTVLVTDVPPAQVVVATRADDHRRLVTGFESCAAAHLSPSGVEEIRTEPSSPSDLPVPSPRTTRQDVVGS